MTFYRFLYKILNSDFIFNKILLNFKHRIYCGLSITSPRTRRLYGPDEREMFISA